MTISGDGGAGGGSRFLLWPARGKFFGFFFNLLPSESRGGRRQAKKEVEKRREKEKRKKEENELHTKRVILLMWEENNLSSKCCCCLFSELNISQRDYFMYPLEASHRFRLTYASAKIIPTQGTLLINYLIIV